jgi:hypothetical protein
MKTLFLLLSNATNIVLHIKYITLHRTIHEFQVQITFLTLTSHLWYSLLKHSEYNQYSTTQQDTTILSSHRQSSDQPWVPPSLLHNGYRVFLGGKWPGSGVDHSPPSSAEIKEIVELYLYSPSGPSWAVIGWSLPLPSVLDVSREMTTKEKASTAFRNITKTGYKMSARRSYKRNDASSYLLILWTYIQWYPLVT